MNKLPQFNFFRYVHLKLETEFFPDRSTQMLTITYKLHAQVCLGLELLRADLWCKGSLTGKEITVDP